MKQLLLPVFLFAAISSQAQEEDFIPPAPIPAKTTEPKSGEEVFMYVDESAEFPGGMAAMKQFLADNIVYPQAALDKGVQGKCYVTFVVTATGEISNVRLVRGIADCLECDMEVVRVIKLMPKWKPARNGGKNVNSYFNLPVSFTLPPKEEIKQ